MVDVGGVVIVDPGHCEASLCEKICSAGEAPLLAVGSHDSTNDSTLSGAYCSRKWYPAVTVNLCFG